MLELIDIDKLNSHIYQIGLDILLFVRLRFRIVQSKRIRVKRMLSLIHSVDQEPHCLLPRKQGEKRSLWNSTLPIVTSLFVVGRK